MTLLKEILTLANNKMQEGHFQLSAEICHSILKTEESPMAEFILATCLSKLKRYDEAIRISKKLAIDARSISNLASIYQEAGMTNEAIAEYERAIKADAKVSEIFCNYAMFLNKIGDFKSCDKQMDHATNTFYSDNVWYVYGTIHDSRNNFMKSKECYLKSLKIKSIPQTHYNLSLAYFQLADYRNGWKEYEWRWKACWLFEMMKNNLGKNFWLGEDLKGKSILIWCEQGIGDLVMFFRYAKALEEMGATVYIKYDDPLFQRQSTEKYDYHCSILTVAGMVGADINTASGKSYLKSTLELEFPDVAGKKVGLCWCGNPGHPLDRKRSIRLKEFGMQGAYSLTKDLSPKQYEDGEFIDWSEGHQTSMIDCSRYMVDLNHTAKLIEWLDVVVTVDTVVAHLAGAVGKKTYLLLPYNCDWRWSGKFGDKTPWYDSVTLVRQKQADDYGECIAQVKKEIYGIQ
jgi:tetratricopeptide (TPR) repeat protein